MQGSLSAEFSKEADPVCLWPEKDSIWFPLTGGAVREPRLEFLSGARWTERHVQCVWADPALRPRVLKAQSGEDVEVISPGRWNLSAGPDFLGAELKILSSGVIIKGDAEVHIRPSDWSRHRHSGDPGYAEVVAHITWFDGSRPEDLPEHIVCIPLCTPVSSNRAFSFDSIDVSSYPHRDWPDSDTLCHSILRNVGVGAARKLLVSAGESRMRRKSAGMAAKLLETGDVREVFFEEFCCALGYKDNSQAFRDTARRISFPAFTGFASPMERYAAFLAAGGLLEQLPQNEAGRAVWDTAWRLGLTFPGGESPPEWKMHGMRPSNMPVRRAAVAAAVLDERIYDEIVSVPRNDSKAWWKRIMRIFHDRLEQAEELKIFGPSLGKERMAAIAVNVILPLLILSDPSCAELSDAIPGETFNSVASETLYRLFGRDFNKSQIADSCLCQQGLSEIWSSFCLQTRGGCLDCRLAACLPELLHADSREK